MKKSSLIFMVVITIFIMTACGKKNEIKFTEIETTESDSGDIIRFDKVLAGNPVNDIKSLYDCSEVFFKDGYRIISGSAYGDNGIMILYSGVNDSKISVYTVSNGTEVSQITFDGIIFRDNIRICFSNDTVTYVYNPDSTTFYFVDVARAKFNEIKLEFEPASFYIADNGERMYYTLENDSNLYQHIFEIANDVSIYDFGKKYENISIEYIEPNNDKIILSLHNKDNTEYECISIELLETTSIESGKKILFAGETKIVCPDMDEAFIEVYNVHKPRIVQKFVLDDAKELNTMYLYPGSPYLLTIVDADDYNTVRFYNISNGIKCNEINISKEYEINKVTYLNMDLTVCFDMKNADGDSQIFLWDLENVIPIEK